MRLTPCLTGHLYINQNGHGVHLSPQDIVDLLQFIDRDDTIRDNLPKHKRVWI